jgi:hypothetical protein
MMRILLSQVALVLLALAFACVPAHGAPAGAALPRPAHVVIVVEENRSLWQIEGDRRAPYLNALMRQGALFTDAHGVTHPSLPNYLALFAGVTNTNRDDCPAIGFDRNAPNLASALRGAGFSFAGYAESLPRAGFAGCWAGPYARKHAPWVEFANVPGEANQPFSALPAYDKLPTVSFVIPNVDNDMHDGTIAQADAWLSTKIAPLVQWGASHNTLLIVTWDEGYDNANHIPTIFVGPMVKAGRYSERVDHYRVLRTIEEMYGLPFTGRAAAVDAIRDCWR